MRQLAAVLGALLLAGGCTLPPRPIEYLGEGGAAETAGGLYRVRSTRVGGLWLRPETSFAGYSALLIEPLRIVPPQRESGSERKRPPGSRDFDASHVDRFARIYREAFERALSRSRSFELVSQPAPNVLRLSGRLADLEIDVPRDRPREPQYIIKAGDMTLVLDVQDSETGVTLMRLADRRAIRPTTGGGRAGTGLANVYESTPVNNWGAVRDVFSEWAAALRSQLDELHFIQYVPAPDAPAD